VTDIGDYYWVARWWLPMCRHGSHVILTKVILIRIFSSVWNMIR